MANTYYDSELTAEEIEEVLEAIKGILTPANNGKVLAISNGKLEARSVQWGGGAPVIEPLSVTQNGTYTAPLGVDGYSPVTVNVSGGLTPITITPIINNASFIGSNGNLVIGSSAYPDYKTIAIDLSQYPGYLIKIVNNGDRNFYGLYNNNTNEQPIQLFNSRQASDGTLEFYTDDWVQFGQWFVYDYTASAQSPPSVSGYVI